MKRIVAGIGLLVLVAAGCSDGGGGGGAAGTYVHPEEGTITLSADGTGTWVQEGNDEPLVFDWTADGDAVTLTVEDESAGLRLEDGDLVVPPDFISGDEDVTFERQ